MTDSALRALERRASAESGHREALLAARLRAGTLTRDRLDLAAYAGEPSAQSYLIGIGWGLQEGGWLMDVGSFDRDTNDDGYTIGFDTNHQAHPTTWSGTFADIWLGGLTRWQDVVEPRGWFAVKCMALAAREIVACLHDRGVPLGAHAVLESLELAEDWADDPADGTRCEWALAYRDAPAEARMWLPVLPNHPSTGLALWTHGPCPGMILCRAGDLSGRMWAGAPFVGDGASERVRATVIRWLREWALS